MSPTSAPASAVLGVGCSCGFKTSYTYTSAMSYPLGDMPNMPPYGYMPTFINFPCPTCGLTMSPNLNRSTQGAMQVEGKKCSECKMVFGANLSVKPTGGFSKGTKHKSVKKGDHPGCKGKQ